MKKLLLLAFVITLFSCKTEQNLQQPTWLIGKWERINKKPNKRTFDFWNKDLTGKGFTLRENDTVFKEIMSIVTINDKLHLKIEGVNDTPTLFKFTQQTDTSFVAENLTHDFPTKIEYWLDKQQLKAKVSNKEFALNFIFDKLP